MYHVSTELNPAAQMSVLTQVEYKRFVAFQKKEQDLSPSPVLDTNVQAHVLAVQQKEAEKNRTKL